MQDFRPNLSCPSEGAVAEGDQEGIRTGSRKGGYNGIRQVVLRRSFPLNLRWPIGLHLGMLTEPTPDVAMYLKFSAMRKFR